MNQAQVIFALLYRNHDLILPHLRVTFLEDGVDPLFTWHGEREDVAPHA